MKGTVFDIQRFCIRDGPGLRVTVFLKGCSLRCRWCHNPEGLLTCPQPLLKEEKCIGCGRCLQACQTGAISRREGRIWLDWSKCVSCLCCTRMCPAEALHAVGQEMEPEEVLRQIRRESPFFGREGGVTFSGGEPLLQPEFLFECLQMCKAQGYHTAVETAGYASTYTFLMVMDAVDLFLYDYKFSNPQRHRQYTGVDNKKIRCNLEVLQQQGANIRIRIPVITGVNDIEIPDMVRDLRGLGISKVELFPYHTIGQSKYQQLCWATPEVFSGPSEEELERYRVLFEEEGMYIYR